MYWVSNTTDHFCSAYYILNILYSKQFNTNIKLFTLPNLNQYIVITENQITQTN